VYGNTTGLKSSQVDALERLYRRYVSPDQVVTQEIALCVAEVSRDIRRQIGLLLDRKGNVQFVVVGDANRIEIPDLGRFRAGRTRLRGLRFVHSHLFGEPLCSEDLTDLSRLSFDLVAVVDARPFVNPLCMTVAHLLPVNPEQKQWEVLPSTAVHDFDLDFKSFIKALEAEFGRKAEGLKARKGRERAVLVFLDDGRVRNSESEVAEFRELANSAGLDVVDLVVQRRRPDPRYLIGRGKLDELLVRTLQSEVDLLVFFPDLSPAQVKSISDLAEVRVIDRTQLILDIFSQRAASRDGRLQVEAAQLKYLMPRLIGAGHAMSRLLGGIGIRGPGETKLETDRRRIRQRLRNLEKQLEELARRRKERRKRRERSGIPIVAIVGYTNTGKSTLLNALTHARANAENKLFATLDPYSRRLRFPRDREIVLTDTVGFIRNLPPDLKTAFKATLEELESADLLLHVVDVSSPWCDEQLEAVEKLLAELDLQWIPRITLFNKMDRLSDASVASNLAHRFGGLAISAVEKATLRPLVALMERAIWEEPGRSAPANNIGGVDEEELRP